MTDMSSETYFQQPYPGLRPFLQEESELFFGRESQIETLIHKLLETHFLAVVGTSGSGKSSLARAGLFPVLEDEYGDSRNEHFHVIKLRPGQNPYQDMARQLSALRGESKGLDMAMQEAFTLTSLRRGPQGLQHWWKEQNIPGRLLLFVDQFEEIFRFSSIDANEAIRFVNMLIASARQGEAPIYVCLTMRSEFLGRCTEFRDLPEMINAGQYLIPRLRRKELRAAIEQPALLAGAALSPRLSTRLINEVGDDPDQLPILQHALMRAYQCWKKEGDPTKPIDLAHLEVIGGLTAALGKHAEEIYAGLSKKEQQAAVALFRTITLMEGGVALRRPLRLSTILEVTGEAQERLVKVIEAFRVASASFLLPGLPAVLTRDCVVDISHESLIRRWARLNHIVDEEAEDAKVYLRLSESAKRNAQQFKLYQAGEADKPDEDYLHTGMDLYSALKLREKRKLTASWGQLQGDSLEEYESADHFLRLSKNHEDRAQKKKRRARNLLRGTVVAVGLLAIGMGIAAAFAFNWYKDAKKSRAATTKIQSQFLSGYATLLLEADPTMNLCLLNQLVVDPQVERPDNMLEISFGSYFHKVLKGEFVVYDSKVSTGTNLTKSAFSRTGNLVAASGDKKLLVWSVDRINPGFIKAYNSTGFLRKLNFSENEREVMALDKQGVLQVFDLENADKDSPILELEKISAASFIADTASTSLVFVDSLGMIKRWEPGQKPKDVFQLTMKEGRRYHELYMNAARKWICLMYKEDGVFMRSFLKKDGEKWKMVSEKTGEVAEGAKSIHFSWNRGKGNVLALVTYEDNTSAIKWIDWRSDRDREQVLKGLNISVLTGHFAPQGDLLTVVAGDHSVSLWNMRGERVGDLVGHRSSVWDAQFSGNGESIVTVSSSGTLMRWRLPTGKNRLFNDRAGTFLDSQVFGDQLQVLSKSDTMALWWDMEQDTLISTYRQAKGSEFLGGKILDQKRALVIESRGKTIRFNILSATGNVEQLPSARLGNISGLRSIAISGDGKHVAIAGSEQKTYIIQIFGNRSDSCNSVELEGRNPIFRGDTLFLLEKKYARNYLVKDCLADLQPKKAIDLPPSQSSISGLGSRPDFAKEDVFAELIQQKRNTKLAPVTDLPKVKAPTTTGSAFGSKLIHRRNNELYQSFIERMKLNAEVERLRSGNLSVTCFDTLPGGKGYAVALSDQSIDLFDQNNQLVARISGFGRDIVDMCAFPDGSGLLLVFMNCSVRVVEVVPSLSDMQRRMESGEIYAPTPQDLAEYGFENKKKE